MRKKLILGALIASLGFTFNGCDNISGTIFEPDTSNSSGATVTIDGVDTYYTDITEAWTVANTNVESTVTFKLWQDWTATEGNFGKVDTTGFNSLGGLVIETRGAVTSKDDTNKSLTINLNGHDINAQRYTAVEGGYVIDLKCTTESNYHGAITICNGTIKGGNNSGNGGGINMSGAYTSITFENLTISENYSAREGGGIYDHTSNCYLTFDDFVVTRNKATVGGGYLSYCADNVEACNKISLKDLVKISENFNTGTFVSTGFYYQYDYYVDDYSNTFGNARFVSFDVTSDSHIVLGFEGCRKFLTLEEVEKTKVQAFLDSYFTTDNEYNYVGFDTKRTETRTEGCDTIEIKYGYLYIN